MELYGVALDRKSVGGACSRHIVALNPFQQHDWLANAAVRQVAPQSSHCPARLQSAFVLASAPPLAPAAPPFALASALSGAGRLVRSEEHTSELQSLMRISYAVFCLKQKSEVSKNNNQSLRSTPVQP